jgi:hypothetical protein
MMTLHFLDSSGAGVAWGLVARRDAAGAMQSLCHHVLGITGFHVKGQGFAVTGIYSSVAVDFCA